MHVHGYGPYRLGRLGEGEGEEAGVHERVQTMHMCAWAHREAFKAPQIPFPVWVVGRKWEGEG